MQINQMINGKGKAYNLFKNNCAQTVVEVPVQTAMNSENSLGKQASVHRYVLRHKWMHGKFKNGLSIFMLFFIIMSLTTIINVVVYADEEKFYSFNASLSAYPFASNGLRVYTTDISTSWITGDVKYVDIYELADNEKLKIEQKYCSKMYIGFCNDKLFYVTLESDGILNRLVTETKVYKYENGSSLIKEIDHNDNGIITQFTYTELTAQIPLVIEEETADERCLLKISDARDGSILYTFDDAHITVWHTFAVIKIVDYISNTAVKYYIWDYSPESLREIQVNETAEFLYRRGGIAKDGQIYFISGAGLSKYNFEDDSIKLIMSVDDINMFCIRNDELYVLSQRNRIIHMRLSEDAEILTEIELPNEARYIAVSDGYIYYTNNPVYSSKINEIYSVNKSELQ